MNFLNKMGDRRDKYFVYNEFAIYKQYFAERLSLFKTHQQKPAGLNTHFFS